MVELRQHLRFVDEALHAGSKVSRCRSERGLMSVAPAR
jgi:hypothetical protein